MTGVAFDGLEPMLLARLLAGEKVPRPPELNAVALAQLGLQSSADLCWLDPELERLDADVVRSSLGVRAKSLWPELMVWPQIGSTNSELMALGEAAAGRLYTTEYQWGGRGRRGRDWHSPIGRNLAYSAAWRTSLALSELGGLSLTAGLATADALHTLGVPGVGLKWPNDVLVATAEGPAKLVGILVELQAIPGGSLAVIGIGINYAGAHLARAQVEQPIADVAELVPDLKRSTLLSAVINALADYLDIFAAEGFASMTRGWDAMDAYAQQAVELRFGDGSVVVGDVLGVSADGALRLATAAGEREFTAGEVSLRPQSRGAD